MDVIRPAQLTKFFLSTFSPLSCQISEDLSTPIEPTQNDEYFAISSSAENTGRRWPLAKLSGLTKYYATLLHLDNPIIIVKAD